MPKVKRVKRKCEKCYHKRAFLKIRRGVKRFRCGFCKNIVIQKIKKNDTEH